MNIFMKVVVSVVLSAFTLVIKSCVSLLGIALLCLALKDISIVFRSN